MKKSTFSTPKWLNKCLRIAPNRSQEVIYFLLKMHFDFGSISEPFWIPKWLPFGNQNRHPNRSKTVLHAKLAQRPLQDRSKPPQIRPEICSSGLKIAPTDPRQLPRDQK